MSAKNLVLASVLGGLVFFIWGGLSWIVFPWHSLESFTDEDAVAAAVRNSAPTAGVYLLPNVPKGISKEDRAVKEKAASERMKQGPLVFAAVQPGGTDLALPALFLRGLLLAIIGAFVLSYLLGTFPGLGYWESVRTVTLVAIISGVLVRLPDWNWWGFSTAYTFEGILDLAIGWFLASLVIARFAKQQAAQTTT